MNAAEVCQVAEKVDPFRDYGEARNLLLFFVVDVVGGGGGWGLIWFSRVVLF